MRDRDASGSAAGGGTRWPLANEKVRSNNVHPPGEGHDPGGAACEVESNAKSEYGSMGRERRIDSRAANVRSILVRDCSYGNGCSAFPAEEGDPGSPSPPHAPWRSRKLAPFAIRVQDQRLKVGELCHETRGESPSASPSGSSSRLRPSRSVVHTSRPRTRPALTMLSGNARRPVIGPIGCALIRTGSVRTGSRRSRGNGTPRR